MRVKHVLRKCAVWLVLVMLLLTSCAAPNKMSLDASKLDKRILTDGGYFYYQGKSYRYRTEGAKVIESLTQDIPEAKFEIEYYRETAKTAAIIRFVGLGMFIAGIIVNGQRSEGYKYATSEEREEEVEERSNRFLGFLIISFVAMMLSDGKGRKATVSLKRAIMYYNKSIDNK